MEPVRKFKIIVNSKECGTCSGATPSAVAKKVVKKLCGTSSKVVKFSLKECKRGCERECGPYQGRMEKLDRPYTRSGKKITHRVVCGKVRKMRGGRELTVEDFKKTDYKLLFKFDTIGLKPYVFFQEISVDGDRFYKYAIFNKELWGGNTKTCGFSELQLNTRRLDIVPITGRQIVSNRQYTENNTNSIKYLLSLLVSYKYRNDYKTIKKELKQLLPPPNNQQEYTICEFMKSNGKRFMSWTRYFNSKITDYLEDVIQSINVQTMADLFKKKTDIKSYTYKKSMFSSFTSYYSVISRDPPIFLFSKNENDEYYNLSFIHNANIYIAIYDADNKIATCYLTKRDDAIEEYYPTDFRYIIRYFVAASQGIRNNKELKSDSTSGNENENGNGNENGNENGNGNGNGNGN